MTRYMAALLVAAALALPLARLGHALDAAVQDHLRCFKVKDPQAKASYTVDLGSIHPSFPNETGCRMKVPAKLFCTPVEKTDVSPAPPNSSVSGAFLNEQFNCYKLKCPKGATLPVPVADQFGSRTLSVGKPKLLCAPANFD